MTPLFVLVEGETEETFVNHILAPHLYRAGYINVSARLMGVQPQRTHRGGIRSWTETRRGIRDRLRQDAGLIVTTMVDYYGLPTSEPRSWPGRVEAVRLPLADRAIHVENAIHSDVAASMGDSFNPARFVPYLGFAHF